MVVSKLNPLLFGKVNHRLINDLILVDRRGMSHQIDHVEIRENGIFCIETKNYKGLIFGSEDQKYWTQCLYHGQRYRMLNPVKQNLSHIYQIRDVLGNGYAVNSVVVMVQNNADRIDIPYVVNLSDLRRYLKNFDNGVRLSDSEMDAIERRLRAADAGISDREHVQSVRETQRKIDSNICPRCGGTLVVRSGKYGEFRGCSNYPDCTFTAGKD